MKKSDNKKSDVTMFKPEKPLRDMTRAEVDALAGRIFQRFVESNPPKAAPKKKK